MAKTSQAVPSDDEGADYEAVRLHYEGVTPENFYTRNIGSKELDA